MELQGDIVFLRNEMLVDKEFPSRSEVEGFVGVGGQGEEKGQQAGERFHDWGF
jgi:hypothetical protein